MFKKVFSLAIVMTIGSFACVNAIESNVAVVDVQKVVANSSQVKALKKEQENNRKELAKFIKNSSDSIKKETDVKKKEALAKKYDKELQAKQEAFSKTYKTKLETIDKNISNAISQQAKALGYDLVLTKGVVLYGAEDITESVLRVVK